MSFDTEEGSIGFRKKGVQDRFVCQDTIEQRVLSMKYYSTSLLYPYLESALFLHVSDLLGLVSFRAF